MTDVHHSKLSLFESRRIEVLKPIRTLINSILYLFCIYEKNARNIDSTPFKTKKWKQFALLYLQSDSTTGPLADAKLSGPPDAFKKGCQITSFLSLLKRDDIIWSPATIKDGFSCVFL